MGAAIFASQTILAATITAEVQSLKDGLPPNAGVATRAVAKEITMGRITIGGSVKNFSTNATKGDFAKALEKRGFDKSLSKDGKTISYTKGKEKYDLRSDKASVNYSIGKSIKAKIRLTDE